MCLGCTLGLMAFTPYGSFDPNDLGFYMALGSGVAWSVSMYFILRKNFK